MHTVQLADELGPAEDLLGLVGGRPGGDFPWLLESARVEPPRARFSLAGLDPAAVVRIRGDRLELRVRRALGHLEPGPPRVLPGEPFATLRSLLPPAPVDGGPDLPFAGGVVLILAHELARTTTGVDLRALDDLRLPDLVALLVDRLRVVDHVAGRSFAVGLGAARDRRTARQRAEAARDAAAGWLRRPSPSEPAAPAGIPVRAHFDEAGYVKAVERAREWIAQGEVYQLCLTHRLEVPFAGAAEGLYARLRRRSPAPFAALLRLPEATLLSASPERFLRVGEDGWVETCPIKGTRPRHPDPGEDARLALELVTSVKERAENAMIVDLMRNDLARACVPGSVEVPELFRVEAHPTVFQLVSVVRGRLRRGADALDVLRDAFPPASMTGAPKLAALRLLDRLEPVCRGFYAGCAGYLDARGRADLSVLIRTVVLRGGRALVQVGGGIVADSVPAAEYRETLDKARAALEALGARLPA